jgi:hypothetical protein
MDINTYLTVVFWTGLAGIFIRSLVLMGENYPRKVTHSVGQDVFVLLVAIAMFVWVCLLKFN